MARINRRPSANRRSAIMGEAAPEDLPFQKGGPMDPDAWKYDSATGGYHDYPDWMHPDKIHLGPPVGSMPAPSPAPAPLSPGMVGSYAGTRFAGMPAAYAAAGGRFDPKVPTYYDGYPISGSDLVGAKGKGPHYHDPSRLTSYFTMSSKGEPPDPKWYPVAGFKSIGG